MVASTRDIGTYLRQRIVPPGEVRHGLVVGIERYRDNRLDLRCARGDARAMYDLMVDRDCGMFQEENVKLLLDEAATRDNVWRALASLRRKAGPGDTVWIYYAGHAVPEGSDLYWVTHEADIDDLYATGLSNEQIARVLNDIHARQVLVLLDCCYAAGTCQKNPRRAVVTPREMFNYYQGHGRITLSSSDSTEKSVELTEVGHGAFTYFLDRGLRGEADRDNDGIITAEELWDYLRRKVSDASRQAGNPQSPVIIGEMTHELPLTLNPVAAEGKKRVADAITGLVGLGPDRLTTDEANRCLDILRLGPRSEHEEYVAAEFDALAAGTIPARTFTNLVRVAVATGNRAAAAAPRTPELPRPETRHPQPWVSQAPHSTVPAEPRPPAHWHPILDRSAVFLANWRWCFWSRRKALREPIDWPAKAIHEIREAWIQFFTLWLVYLMAANGPIDILWVGWVLMQFFIARAIAILAIGRMLLKGRAIADSLKPTSKYKSVPDGDGLPFLRLLPLFAVGGLHLLLGCLIFLTGFALNPFTSSYRDIKDYAAGVAGFGAFHLVLTLGLSIAAWYQLRRVYRHVSLWPGRATP